MLRDSVDLLLHVVPGPLLRDVQHENRTVGALIDIHETSVARSIFPLKIK